LATSIELIKAKMLNLSNIRKSNDAQIWIAGCSISHGMGVKDHERYGELIAKELNLPVSFLTAPGSSIRWASDQILRSDIRPNDIIFWGLTSCHRFSCWDELTQEIVHTALRQYDDHYLDRRFLKILINKQFLASDQMIYESLVSIHNVLNCCNKNNITLILSTLIQGVEIYLQGVDNFVPLSTDRHLDRGTDNSHPGPKSHQFFKEKMLELYYQINGSNK